MSLGREMGGMRAWEMRAWETRAWETLLLGMRVWEMLVLRMPLEMLSRRRTPGFRRERSVRASLGCF